MNILELGKEKDWETKEKCIVLLNPNKISSGMGTAGIHLDFMDGAGNEICLTGMTPDKCDELMKQTKKFKEILEHYHSLSEKEKKKYWEDM